MTDDKIVFQGEMQLTAWGESNTTGAWVKFWVHPDDLEQFKLLRVRSGKTAGQRLATVQVEIADDETAVVQAPAATPAPEPARRHAPPRVGALGMLAVRWCNSPVFKEWIHNEYAETVPADFMPAEKDQAKRVLCHVCDIDSRKRLDTDSDAGENFNELVRVPFRDYLNMNGIDL